ncbi:MAG: LacI family transcriptional regulator [Gammaproteobacteria bacterium]|nr:LacI family transcriptional regulator [Gammaproteobacteria bacterium]NND60758.1 LacI family DNA-binding transcriptional regulator [Gammaproteobacteria bacterium]
MKSRPTSRDIAHAAGVSQATVSRALRNSPLVRPETREKISRIAQELNYRVDRSAAGLRTRQSRTLALLLFEDVTADTSHINPFFLALLSSITRAAAAREYDVLVSFQQLSRDWVARYEASNRADGIILLGYGDFVRFAERLEHLKKADAHFVLWGPDCIASGVHTVGCDNRLGGIKATRHLLDLGRRRPAFVGNSSDVSPEFQARFAGFSATLQDAGISIDDYVIDAGSTVEAGYRAAAGLLRNRPDVDAIFAASDLIAIGACRALNEIGKSVPEDISVVGFDDIPSAIYMTPTLTTIRQDTTSAGEQLVDLLLETISGADAQSRSLQPELIVRQSCGGLT